MSDAPKHIWQTRLQTDNHRKQLTDRYTLTSGPEWNALIKRLQYESTQWGTAHSRRATMAALLAYFEERNDG